MSLLPVETYEGCRIIDADGLIFGEAFQRRTYDNPRKRVPNGHECVFCGRDTSRKGECQGALVSGGGVILVHPDDYDTYPHQGGDMGWFPIGAECIKRIPAEFRVWNPYDDKMRMV